MDEEIGCIDGWLPLFGKLMNFDRTVQYSARLGGTDMVERIQLPAHWTKTDEHEKLQCNGLLFLNVQEDHVHGSIEQTTSLIRFMVYHEQT